jgi:isoamylase
VRIWPGSPYPPAAVFNGGGTKFSIFSEVTERVVQCVFDDDIETRGISRTPTA